MHSQQQPLAGACQNGRDEADVNGDGDLSLFNPCVHLHLIVCFSFQAFSEAGLILTYFLLPPHSLNLNIS